eukprot:2737823-Prymnesium_polylepis.1
MAGTLATRAAPSSTITYTASTTLRTRRLLRSPPVPCLRCPTSRGGGARFQTRATLGRFAAPSSRCACLLDSRLPAFPAAS